MRLIELRNKVQILIYSYVHRLRKRTNPSTLKEIMVIESGRIGDSIMFLGALRALDKAYCPQNGYRITLVCRKDMCDFLKENLSKHIYLSPVEIENVWPTFQEFKRVAFLYKDCFFHKCLVLMSHGWGDYLAFYVHAEQKATLLMGMKRKKTLIKLLIRHSYQITVSCEGDNFLPNITKQFMDRIGCGEYKVQSEKIYCPVCNSRTSRMSYVIIAPMANVSFRNLTKGQCELIVKYVLKKTDSIILITGRECDVKYIEEIVSKCSNERVKNYAGKTDFDALLKLITQADFLVSADSGQIHLAAALNVPSICLTGYWDKGQFVPYKFSEKSASDPICIYCKEKYCKYCKGKRGDVGIGNKECRKRVKMGEAALCLEEIEMKDVYKAIDILLDSEQKKCRRS